MLTSVVQSAIFIRTRNGAYQTVSALRARAKSRLATDILLTSFSGTIVLGLGVLGGLLNARLLGPEGRGEIATALVWIGLLVALGDLGMSQSIAYHVAKTPNLAGGFIGTAITLACGLGLFLASLAEFILIPILKSHGAAVDAMRYYVLAIPLTLTISVLTTAFQGLGDFILFNVLRILQAGTYAIGMVSLAALNWKTPRYVTAIMILAQLGVTTAGVFMLRRRVPFVQWRYKQTARIDLLSYGIRSYAGNLAWLANGKLDQALCSLLLPTESLGLYAVSVSYGTVLFGVSGAFANVAFHRVASASDRQTGCLLVRRLLCWNLVLNILLATILIGGASFLVPLLFGPSFGPSVPAGKVLVVAGILLGANYILSNGLRGIGCPLDPSKAEGIGLVLNIGMIAYLARYGTIGIALASCVTYLIVAILLVLFLRRATCRPLPGPR